MWVNVGMSQFHLPTGQPSYLRGTTGLVIPDRAALLERLNEVKKHLEGTKFSFRETNDGVETTCPWGNRITVHEPDPARGSAACSSAWPTSCSTCGPAPRAASPASTARSWARPRR
jgi:hypothetical protein